MLTTILGLIILFAFSLFEGRLRQGAAASSYEAGEHDRQSTGLLGLAYMVCVLAVLLSFVLNAFQFARLPVWVGWVGVALAVVGVLLRSWSNRVLGAFYTRTLKVTDGQSIVQAGPYHLVRHPGYLGMILTWLGVSAATANGLVLPLVLLVIVAVYMYRIRSEEQMLLTSLPGYAEYSRRTWRLIPLIY